MRLRTALGIAGLLIAPTASADYAFSFNTRSDGGPAGASYSDSAGGVVVSEGGSAGSSLGGGDGGLASLSRLAAGPTSLGAANDRAAGEDGALDCFDSSSTVPDSPRATQSCWLIALASAESAVPLPAKATDPYPIATPGSQDWNDWYPPTAFGGNGGGSSDNRSGSGGSPSDNRTGTASGGGSAGATAASTSDSRDDATSGPSAGATDPFHFHTGSDGRGGDVISLGQTDGTDSSSHHHHGGTSGGGTTGGDTSTSLIDASLITSTDSVAPTHHRARDPIFATVVDPATAASTLNTTTIDQVLTGPTVNVSADPPAPIPEPGTLVLVGLALVAIAVLPKGRR
jgi:PEP-CTERM motif-containing protein